MKAIYVLILAFTLVAADTPIDTFFNFFKGYSEGINKEKQFNEIFKCIQEGAPVIYYYNAVWNKIKKLNPMRPVEIFEVIALYITAVRKTTSHLSNYPNIYNEIEKLFFGHVSIITNFFFLFCNFYMHYQEVLTEVIKFIKAEQAIDRGKSLGFVTYELLFNTSNIGDADFGLKQFLVIADNFLVQIIDKSTHNDVSDCLRKIPHIYELFLEGIKKIIENDFKDIKKLIDGIVKLIYTMIEALSSAQSCAKLPPVLVNLVNKIYSTSIKEITNRFIKYAAFIVGDFFLALDAMRNKEYDMVGRGFG